jgi:hypothetical protein
MQSDGDVMRSDRLKQVMRTIDPHFDERDAGFNRFSKFVVGAAQRGLLQLERLDNGQYSIELGANANVPPAAPVEAATPAAERVPDTRRRPGRRRAAAPADESKILTLMQSFELLRQALSALGAEGDDSTESEQARQQMITLCGADSDPVFEAARFQRMLRQAHDADLIELIKHDDGGYRLKLSASAVASGTDKGMKQTVPAEEQAEPDDAKPKGRRPARRKKAAPRAKATPEMDEGDAGAGGKQQDRPADTAEAEATPSEQKPTRKKKTTRRSSRPKAKAHDESVAPSVPSEERASASKVAEPERATKRSRSEPAGRSSRSRTRASRKTAEPGDEPAAVPASPSPSSEQQSPEHRPPARMNPRFRRGSRGATPGAAQAESSAQTAEPAETAPPLRPPVGSDRRGSVRGRGGSRGPQPRREPETEGRTTPAPPVAPPVVDARPTASSPAPDESRERPQAADALPEVDDGVGESEGLFRRLTAALQRAVQGASTSESDPDQ